jgi:hypothetical protein
MEGLKNGEWEGEFGGACKMEVCLEALLELDFCTKPPNFGVEAHMETSTGVVLRVTKIPSTLGLVKIRNRKFVRK